MMNVAKCKIPHCQTYFLTGSLCCGFQAPCCVIFHFPLLSLLVNVPHKVWLSLAGSRGKTLSWPNRPVAQRHSLLSRWLVTNVSIVFRVRPSLERDCAKFIRSLANAVHNLMNLIFVLLVCDCVASHLNQKCLSTSFVPCAFWSYNVCLKNVIVVCWLLVSNMCSLFPNPAVGRFGFGQSAELQTRADHRG